MSEKVPKSRISTFTYFALATFALLSGFYVTSRIQHWHASGPVVKTSSAEKQDHQVPELRAKEYAAYKQVFLEKVSAYKAVLAQQENAAVIKVLNDYFNVLAAIEAEYIKVKPSATEPDRVKLKRMIGDYSSLYKKLEVLNYELGRVREFRSEVTNAHSILLLTSPKLYADDKDEVKKVLKDVDQGTINIYECGNLISKIERLTDLALYRLKPEQQEATPELRLQAGMEAIELYLNELTVRNAPPKQESE
jgi:hypothetical protein